MRQAPREALKLYLAHFTYEIAYFPKVTNAKALFVIKRRLNANTLFWKDVRNKKI